MTLILWMGIVLCLSQSAMLSGLNLAFFSLSKLELRIEVKKNTPRAQHVLSLREDANFLLVTILWGNVAVNVLRFYQVLLYPVAKPTALILVSKAYSSLREKMDCHCRPGE